MKFFLKLKHWQLFLLIFGLPVLSRILFAYYILTESISDKGIITNMFMLDGAVTIVSTILFLVWLWSAGIGLQNYLPKELSMNRIRFITACAILILLVLIYLVIFGVSFGKDSFNLDFFSFAVLILIVFVVILLGILLIPLVYCIYFVSKTIKTLEMMKEVNFMEIITEFLQLLLFPIGIWLIQPRINNLLKE